MAANDNTSTLGSYVNAATGAVQSGIASITGNTGDKIDAETNKHQAEVQNDTSHAAAKAGPFAISSTGVPAKDNADRTQGQWDQTIGSLKEAGGNLIGNNSLKQAGREQNQKGQELEAKGQLTDLGQGLSDRVTGSVGGAVAALTGDREGEKKYAAQHDEGKSRQRGVELDLQKEAEAIDRKPEGGLR